MILGALIIGSLMLGASAAEDARPSTAATTTAVSMDAPQLVTSPSNWNLTGKPGAMAMEAVFVGSYFRATFDGTGVDILVDTSGLKEYPWVGTRIDEGKDVIAKLEPEQKSIRIADLAPGKHTLFVFYHARNDFNVPGTWADAQKLRITGLEFSGGKGILPTAARPLKGILYGDSITAGLALGAAPGVKCLDKYINGSIGSYAYYLANGLNAEYDQAGCGADGWNKGGVGNFPAFSTAWNLKKQGVVRDLSHHDFATIYHGYNEGKVSGSVVTAMLEKLRGANATMWIFPMIPFSGRCKAGIESGVAAYLTAHPQEKKIVIIDTTGAKIVCSDGIHPTPAGSIVLADLMIAKIKPYLDEKPDAK